MPAPESPTVTALLGPTNTGKTHRAVTQMLEHRTGLIGLPLRLLAREVYDRVSAQVGEAAVALVTGEEKRVPARPRYWVCTVESMPVERRVDFLAVDEIQLAAHRERGHVFTDRLLRARGEVETMFLGSDTMTGAIAALVPTARVERHPRFSRLRATPPAELAELPPRSAVVAFSADQVYALAEQLRRRRGGAAVVLGALSPRTRNAQVAMYQAGEVSYLVATDAIGMGLNMDIDHVAFAGLGKFDGRQARTLEAAELAQIAGRAGRYTRDGTFGALTGVGPLPQGLALAIERHQFPSVERVVWRNADLDYSSVEALARSLRVRPQREGLRLLERCDDEDALAELTKVDEVRALARGPEAVALLWDVCRIPDFRKLLEGSHARLLAGVYLQLARAGRLGEAWIEGRIRRLDDTEGDIEALMSRIAAVRTWTYISHHPGWVPTPERWQEWSRAIEDRLSDALHDRLTQRFVDPRAGRAGRARPAKAGPWDRLRALQVEVTEQEVAQPAVPRLIEAGHAEIQADAGGRVLWEGRAVAQLTRGPELLRPELRLLGEETFGPGAKVQVRRCLVAWARDLVAELLAPLRGAEGLSPAGRGLLYQLEQGLGSVTRARADAQVRSLGAADRRALARIEVEVGEWMVYARPLLTPTSVLTRAALWAGWSGERGRAPPAGVTAARGEEEVGYWYAIGMAPLGPVALRVDVAEALFVRLAAETRAGPAPLPAGLAAGLGCSEEALEAIAGALGFVEVDAGRLVLGRGGARRPRR